MNEIRDCHGKLICKGDATTGLIETQYRGYKTFCILAIGETFTIERNDVVTHIIRFDTNAFRVESYALAA